MQYIIAIIIIIGLIYLLVVYVIAPIAGILLLICLVLGFGYAFYTSVRSFITSFIRNRNPYKSYIDKSKAAIPGLNRNYFFGPGYHQIGTTVKESFSLQRERLESLANWKDNHLNHEWYKDMWIYIFYGLAVFCTFVLGFVWMAVFSVLLSTVLFSGMCGFYLFFMSLWGVDRLMLLFKSIQSRCPNCKRISVVPVFACPDCGMEHKKLTPGPYGILKRKCKCKKFLSTTYFNGRSEYQAICPFCDSGLAASDARQFGIQLVGGVSTGKTTFLAAFWHEYLERFNTIKNISTSLHPDTAFADLEDWFTSGDSSATSETNANMYSVIHKYENKTPVQMTIYDIAGEAFTSLSNDIQQQQFKYCESIVFVIDPTASPTQAAGTISAFIDEFAGLKGNRSIKMSDMPVAVLITKADLHKTDIGLPKIKEIFNSNAAEYADVGGNTSMDIVRSGVCKKFLKNRGFGNALNLIDAKFNKVQFYAVSAMGHPAARGKKYEPWGVLEPITWLMRQHGAVFQDILNGM
jgi:GTPase SAR1 family protein